MRRKPERIVGLRHGTQCGQERPLRIGPDSGHPSLASLAPVRLTPLALPWAHIIEMHAARLRPQKYHRGVPVRSESRGCGDRRQANARKGRAYEALCITSGVRASLSPRDAGNGGRCAEHAALNVSVSSTGNMVTLKRIFSHCRDRSSDSRCNGRLPRRSSV